VGTKAGDATVPRAEDVWIGGAGGVSIADGGGHTCSVELPVPPLELMQPA